MNEIIKTDLLQVNYHKVQERVETAVKGYRNIVIHEDNLDEIAKAAAFINKVLTEINKERIEIDKEWRKPLAELKKNYDEIIAEGQKVVDDLKSGLREFDDKRKAKVYDQINEIFKGYEIEEFSLNDLFDQSWYNKTSKYESDSKNLFERISNDIKHIKSYDETKRALAIENYLRTKDITMALEYANTMIKKIESLKEEKEKVVVIEQIEPKVSTIDFQNPFDNLTPKIIVKDLNQFELVVEYMEENDIKFELE